MSSTKSRAVLAIVAMLVASWTASAPEPEFRAYVNERYGFAFEYPASWVLTEKQGVQSGAAILSLKLLSPDENVPVRRDYSPGSLSIDVFANPDRRPLREWLDQHGWPFDAAGRSVTPTSLGGLPALEVATGKMFAPNRFIYLAHQDWVLRVSAIEPESQQVVRSIRFDR